MARSGVGSEPLPPLKIPLRGAAPGESRSTGARTLRSTHPEFRPTRVSRRSAQAESACVRGRVMCSMFMIMWCTRSHNGTSILRTFALHPNFLQMTFRMITYSRIMSLQEKTKEICLHTMTALVTMTQSVHWDINSVKKAVTCLGLPNKYQYLFRIVLKQITSIFLIDPE